MKRLFSSIMVLGLPALVFGSEADLKIPALETGQYNMLLFGFLICILGLLFGLYQFIQVKKLGAHKRMLDVAHIIFETCKTYLIQQGKFLLILFAFIAACIAFYFGFLQQNEHWRRVAYPDVVCNWYSGFLWCSMVWYSHEYTGQQPHGFRFSRTEAA